MRLIHLATLTLILCALAGCAGLNSTSKASKKNTSLPLGASTSDQAGNYYYYFDDVLVPREMDLDADETFIMETSSEKIGVMIFDGSVERLSLTRRIIDNMASSGWTMRSAFKSSRTILIFEKPGRFCIINITDGRYTTHMEIWVAPSTGASPSLPSMSYSPGQPDAAVQPPSTTTPHNTVQEQGLTQ